MAVPSYLGSHERRDRLGVKRVDRLCMRKGGWVGVGGAGGGQV